MSEFSDAMSLSWETSARVFGDSVTIAGSPYDCIIHVLNYSDEVQQNRPGRNAVIGGQIVMRLVDWTAAGGRKGTQVVFDFGTLRVTNDPAFGPTSAEVVLNIGPLT